MSGFASWVIENKEWLFSGVGLVILAWIVRKLFRRTRDTSSQAIRAGDNSANIQAGRDVNIKATKSASDVEEG